MGASRFGILRANFLVGFFVQFTTFYESTEVMLDGGESLIGWIFF